MLRVEDTIQTPVEFSAALIAKFDDVVSRYPEGKQKAGLLPILHLVQADGIAIIRAGDGVAMRIEIESPGVAAPLGEQLERLRDWVVTPDALLELNAADFDH